ncbi:uncharacterized protein [Ptychodera flava]|uniref:uncharacterized protein n=1 Tax=Ptychodera flava TaxID=63121 RepID=UPI003969E7B9
MSEFDGHDAMPISEVQPHMKARKGSETSGKITYSTNTSDMVKKLHDSGFLDKEKLTFIVHGYVSNIEAGWIKDMENFMVKEDPTVTVVRLDWTRGAAIDLAVLRNKRSSFKRRLAEIRSLHPGIKRQMDTFETEITNFLMRLPVTGPHNMTTILQRNIQTLQTRAWVTAINSPLNIFRTVIPKPQLLEWFSDQEFVDWLSIYHRAAATTQPVGEWLGDVAKEIKKEKPGIKIHGVGHSLGAHLLGKAGRSSGVFSRITALDPAGPDFEDGARDKMLRKSDADFVDVIHTNGFYDGIGAKLIPVNHLGTLIPLGTVDFYPNYGYDQVGFDHFRAMDYYNFSIKNPGVLTTNMILDGVPEQDKPIRQTKEGESAEMGYYCKESSRGLYYIPIAPDVSPYVF